MQSISYKVSLHSMDVIPYEITIKGIELKVWKFPQVEFRGEVWEESVKRRRISAFKTPRNALFVRREKKCGSKDR